MREIALMLPRIAVWTSLSLAVAALAPAAGAALLASNTLISPTTIDFSEFVASPVENATGPIQIGGPVGEDIEYSALFTPSRLYAYDGSWSFGSNGIWSDRDGFIALDDPRPGTMVIRFDDGPVSGVGAFMNYCPDCDASSLVISAYGEDPLFPLETWDVTSLADILTPGSPNDGAFRGIQRATADIREFRVTGYVPGLDDLAFTRVAVPEPSRGVLLGLGLAAMIGGRRGFRG